MFIIIHGVCLTTAIAVTLVHVLNDELRSLERSMLFYHMLLSPPLPTLVQNPYQVVFVHSLAMSLFIFLWFVVILHCFS